MKCLQSEQQGKEVVHAEQQTSRQKQEQGRLTKQAATVQVCCCTGSAGRLQGVVIITEERLSLQVAPKFVPPLHNMWHDVGSSGGRQTGPLLAGMVGKRTPHECTADFLLTVDGLILIFKFA